jgi:VWFA-related protein
MKRLVLAAAAVALVVGAAPKKSVVPSIGETIEVSIVNVDVIVTDKAGNRVRGLTKDDFTVVDNGTPRDISNFAEYASPLPDTEASGTMRAETTPAQPRTVLLFMERNKIQPVDADQVVESLREAVRNTIRRGDAMGIVIWSPVKQVRVDFTDDVQKLEAVLDTLKRDLSGAQRDTPAELTQEVDDIMNFEEEIALRMLEFDVAYVMTDRSIVVEHVGAMESLSELTRMKRKVAAINAAINSMAAAEGRKILLLGTHRLGEIAGGEFFYDSGEDFLSQEVRNRYNTRGLIESIIRNANAGGVTIYPFYPAGRPMKVTPSESGSEYLTVMNEMETLTRMAKQTGGVEASGPAESAGLFRRVEDDISDYYSLAYRMDSNRADRKRDITVRAKNPAYTVRARRSYVEKSDETRMKDRLTAALVRTTNDSMFVIEAAFGDPKKQKRSTETMPLQVKIPIGALTMVPENGTNVGAFSVYVMAGAGGDEVSSVRQQTQRFEIPPGDVAKAVSGHFTYDLDLVVNHKADRVAVGVLDELSKSYAVLRLPVK